MKNRELLEVQNSVLSLTVGLVFIVEFFADGNLYQRFPDTYRFMKFLPSIVWGLLFSVAGFIHLATLYLDKLSALRKEILLIKGVLWVFLGFCVVYADKYAAAGWLYIWFAVFAAFCFLRFQKRSGPPHDETQITMHPNLV